MNKKFFFFAATLVLLCACQSTQKNHAPSLEIVGSYRAHYDAQQKNFEIYHVSQDDKTSSGHRFLLDYNDTTGLTNPDGLTGGAIRDTSKTAADINYEMGLVDPDSCATEYNETTKTLSFYAKLVNKSNYANNGSPYTYMDATDFPPNTTFYSPFYFKITGLDWDTVNYPGLITAVNTNFPGAECGANGLTLINDDDDDNGRFDCIYPDQNYVTTDEVDPGWDFTPFVTGGDMTPGEDTGCVLFMQYTLTQNQNFILYFDLLGIKDDGLLPSIPTITTPSNNSYVNTSAVTVTGTCTTGSTVYVEGGLDNSPPPSTTCSGGTYSRSVNLNLNQENVLHVYQVVTSKQSPAANLIVTHDNVAPILTSQYPANSETNVDRNVNCIFTFNEPMLQSSFTTGTNCTNGTFRMCRSTTFVSGSISFAGGDTQAIYTPTTKPLNASASHNCRVTAGVTDLAGNAATATTATWTTISNAAQYLDINRPFVRNIFPPDNATISPNASFSIYFSEAMTTSNLTSVEGACSASVPNIAVFELSACNASPQPVTGTVSANADGTIVTFTPSTALEANNCYGLLLTSCLKDLTLNTLPSRGTRSIGAYSGDDVTYNSYNVFFTGPTDSTAPTLVHVSPFTNQTGVSKWVAPFWVFDEPIVPEAITSDYFFVTKFGYTTKLPATLRQDPSFQFIQMFPTAEFAQTPTDLHVATVTGAITDFAGNQMAAPQTSQFTVTSTADTTPPTVVSVSPANGSTVSRCSYVDIYFSEPMDVSTLNSANIYLQRFCNNAYIPTSLIISDNRMHVRMIPTNSMRISGGGGACNSGPNQDNHVPYITTGVKDAAGNAMSATYSSTNYNTANDSTAPTVTSIVPGNGSSLYQNGSFVVFFSEQMDRTTITASNLTLGDCNPIVNVDEEGKYAIVNCINNMNTGADTLTVNTSVKDYARSANYDSCEEDAGNALNASSNINFTVLSGQDTTKPTVSAVSPTDGQTSVSTSVAPTITFSEPIDPRTVTKTSILLVDRAGNIINSRISISSTATVVTLTPIQTLSSGDYYILATSAVRDLQGGNPYDGAGGESAEVAGVLRTCFSTDASACP